MRDWIESMHSWMGGLETNGDRQRVQADTGGKGQTVRLRDVSEIFAAAPHFTNAWLYPISLYV